MLISWLFFLGDTIISTQSSLAQQNLVVRTFGLSTSVYALTVRGDNVLASGGGSSRIRHWKINDTNFVLDYNLPSRVSAFAASDSHWFAGLTNISITRAGLLSDILTGYMTINSNVYSMIVADNNYVFSGHADGTVWRWDIKTLSRQLVGRHQYYVESLAVNGAYLFSAGFDGFVRQWRINDCVFVRSFGTGGILYFNNVISVGNLVLASYSDTIYAWQISTGSQLMLLKGHSFSILALAASGDYLFSAGDQMIKQWQISTGQLIRNLTEHTLSIAALTINDDRYLFSGSYDGTVKQWAIPELLAIKPSPTSVILTTAWNPKDPDDSNDKLTDMTQTYLIVGIVVGLLLVVVVATGGLVKIKQRHLNSANRKSNQRPNLSLTGSVIQLAPKSASHIISPLPLQHPKTTTSTILQFRPPTEIVRTATIANSSVGNHAVIPSGGNSIATGSTLFTSKNQGT